MNLNRFFNGKNETLTKASKPLAIFALEPTLSSQSYSTLADRAPLTVSGNNVLIDERIGSITVSREYANP